MLHVVLTAEFDEIDDDVERLLLVMMDRVLEERENEQPQCITYMHLCAEKNTKARGKILRFQPDLWYNGIAFVCKKSD